MRSGILIFLLYFSSVTRADEPVDIEEVAERHLQRAQAAVDVRSWWIAMQEFQAAAPVLTPQQLDYELARCLDNLGREQEAISRLLRCAEHDGELARAARARLEEIDERIAQRQHPPRSMTSALVLGAGTLLAAGVAGVLVGSALPPLADLDRLGCPLPCETRHGLVVRADFGYALFGVAGAAAIVDAALWMMWKRSHRPPPKRIWSTTLTF